MILNNRQFNVARHVANQDEPWLRAHMAVLQD
jgi:hypothetical protein